MNEKTIIMAEKIKKTTDETKKASENTNRTTGKN